MTVGWFVLFVAVAVLGIAMVIAGLRWRRSRPLLGVLVAAAGGVATLAAIAMPVATTLLPSDDDTVWVSGLANGDPRFSLDVPHDAVSVEGSRYVFASDLTWDELIEQATEQYPSGAVNDEGWWWTGNGDTVFVLSRATDGADEYVASAQVVVLEGDPAGDGVAVPFPALALSRDAVEPGESLDVDWGVEQWGEFYALIGVESVDQTFAVPTSDGGTANVVVEGAGIAAIERAG